MKWKGDVYRLETGRKFFTFAPRAVAVIEGYPHPDSWDELEGLEVPFTAAEREEISEFMQGLWAQWKALS